MAHRCEQTSNASREHHYRRTPVNYSKDYPLLLLVPLLVPLLVVKWRLKQIKLILRYIINSMPEHAKIRQKPYIQSAKNAVHEVVGVRGFAGEIFLAQRRESRKSNGCITSRHLFFRNMFETIYRVGHSSKRNQKQTDKPISHSFPDNAI